MSSIRNPWFWRILALYTAFVTGVGFARNERDWWMGVLFAILIAWRAECEYPKCKGDQ